MTMHPAATVGLFVVTALVATALVGLWVIDGVRPDCWDLLGVTVTVIGMAIIFFGPRGA